jgi:sialic acid synthase SpsE
MLKKKKTLYIHKRRLDIFNSTQINLPENITRRMKLINDENGNNSVLLKCIG